MNNRFDFLIIGGGVIGLSAAIAMRQARYTVAVIDAGELSVQGLAANGRVYAVNHASEALFRSLNVWDEIDKTRVAPYTTMHVWDAKSQACIEFDSRMVARDRLGTIIEESAIRQALLQKAIEEGIVLLPMSQVTAIHSRNNVKEVICGADRWQAQLLIIADGAASKTREMLGVQLTSWPYHHHAIVATVATQKPHQNTAYQVFNPNGPLAFLPLSNPHHTSIVWSTTPNHAKALMKLNNEDFNAALTHAFAERLGKNQTISKRFEFPLTMRHVQQYSGPGWLIMGDAAHTIHPLAGLGLNVGLADVSAWQTILSSAQHKPWSSRCLSAYQRNRKHSVWKTIAVMEGLKTLFANPLLPIVKLRGLGLRTCNRISFLKRFFIDQAEGEKF